MLLILSVSWSIYLIKSLIDEHKCSKMLKKIRNEISEEEWKHKRLSYVTLQTKRLLMLGICITEVIWTLFAVLLAATALFVDDYDNIPYSYENDYSIVRLADESKRFDLRFGYSGFMSLFIVLLGQVRILTEYMVNRYSRYKREVSLGKDFFLLGLQFILVFVIGLMKETFLIAPFIFVPLACYQYLQTVLSTRTLAKWLKSRYFDAKHHEYLSEHNVRYYKRLYMEFKIASGVVLITLFFHIFAFILAICFPIVQMVITNPDWLHKQYPFLPGHLHYTFNYYGPKYGILVNIINILYESSFVMGMLFHVLPYLLVTGNRLKVKIASVLQYRKGVYIDREKIKSLLEKNYRAYRN